MKPKSEIESGVEAKLAAIRERRAKKKQSLCTVSEWTLIEPLLADMDTLLEIINLLQFQNFALKEANRIADEQITALATHNETVEK